MPEANLDTLAIHLISGLGAVSYRRLLARFGSAEGILRAPEEALASVDGLGASRLQTLVKMRQQARQKAQEELKKAASIGARILDLEHPDYPAALRSLFDPPLVVYVMGQLLPEDAVSVAVVGTRRPSLYGETAAQRFASQLAERGFTIVSGLARGIDAAAHRGALDAGGRTIGVMGSGLDVPYPLENKELMAQITRSGALVSELPLGSPPNRETFPRRNRLISGLSLGTIIVEGQENSGAMITARMALEQGREVFAVPGRIDDPRSRGPHLLIKQGAKLVAKLEDVLAELGPVADFLKPKPPPNKDEGARLKDAGGSQEAPPVDREPESVAAAAPAATAQPPAPLPAAELRVLEAVGSQPTAIDDIIAATGLSPQEVSSHLLVLEIRRLARRLAGNMYARTKAEGGRMKDERCR